MKTILILGGGGFLANEIEEHFHTLGWRTVAIGRRASSSHAQINLAWVLPHPEFGALVATEKPWLCVNAAGTTSVANSLSQPMFDFYASAGLSIQVLEELRLHSPETIYIQLSSAAVYGNPAVLPVSEDAPIAPISPYGWHRRITELAVEEYARQFGLRAASLRIFSAYGVGLKRQVVWDLASRAVASSHGQLLVQGSADDSRDFIHGADVAQAVQSVVQRGALVGECYNVASGIETPIRVVAALVLGALECSSQIRFDGHRHPGNPRRWHADIGKLRSLGFAPRIELEDGVRQVVEEAKHARD